MPELHMDLGDRLAEGWASVVAGDEDAGRLRRAYAAGRASDLAGAIWWPATNLRNEPGANRVLNLWHRCKVSRMRFDGEVRRKGWSRATCSGTRRDLDGP